MDKLNFAGIGSQEIPEKYLEMIDYLAFNLCKAGARLYSGGASGSDWAFEFTYDKLQGSKKIFLPWKGFNGSDSTLHGPPARAYAIAEEIHPIFFTLSQGNKRLHARNIQQVLGEALDDPVDFVICYRDLTKKHSGTDTAMNLAKREGIPVYNLYDLREWEVSNEQELWELIKEKHLGLEE